jgi:hypothetical protein
VENSIFLPEGIIPPVFLPKNKSNFSTISERKIVFFSAKSLAFSKYILYNEYVGRQNHQKMSFPQFPRSFPHLSTSISTYPTFSPSDNEKLPKQTALS